MGGGRAGLVTGKEVNEPTPPPAAAPTEQPPPPSAGVFVCGYIIL